MSTDRLHPWQRIPTILCEYCDQQATERVTAGGLIVTSTAVGVTEMQLTAEPETAAVLTCSDHSKPAMDMLCAAHGCAGAMPLRDSWRYWFLYEMPLTRWLGDIQVWVHNTRFERGAEGKRWFAYPMDYSQVPFDDGTE